MIQMKYLYQDVNRLIGRRKIRIFQIVFSRIFWGIFVYRIERQMFLIFGKYYQLIRLPLIPLFFVLNAYSNIEIHYRANIKGGLLVHHASAGVVISAFFCAGRKLTLTGGNVIGIHNRDVSDVFRVGNNVNIGANATIIGPLSLGNNVRVGSLCCVSKSFNEDNIVLVGVPARKLA